MSIVDQHCGPIDAADCSQNTTRQVTECLSLCFILKSIRLESLSVCTDRKIKATEQEFQVEESLTNQIRKSHALHSSLNTLHRDITSALNRKSEITKNVVIVQQQISEHFENITSRTIESRASIFEEMGAFRSVHEESTAELQSKMEHIESIRNEIGTELESQRSQLAKVKSLLEDRSINRKDRKMEIIRIGQSSDFRFESKHCGFRDAVNGLNAAIAGTDSNDTDDLMVGVHAMSYNKIRKHLAKFGKLKYKAFQPITTEITTENTTETANSTERKTEDIDTRNLQKEGPSNTARPETEGQIQIRNDNAAESQSQCRSQYHFRQRIESLNHIISEKDKLIESMRCDFERMLSDKMKENQRTLNVLEQEVVNKETKIKELHGLHETLQIRHRDSERLVSKKSEIIGTLTKSERALKRNVEALKQQLQSQRLIKDTANAQKSEIKRLEQTVNAQKNVIEHRNAENAKLKTISLRLDEALRMERDRTLSVEPGSQKWAEVEVLQSQMAEQEQAHLVEMEAVNQRIARLQSKIKAQNEEMQTQRECVKETKNEMKRQRIDFNKQRVEWHRKQRQKEMEMKAALSAVPKAKKGVVHEKIVQLPPVNGHRNAPKLQIRNSFVRKVGVKSQSSNRNRKGRYHRFAAVTAKCMQFNGQNGRDYIEDFCRIGKYEKPKVTTKRCPVKGWECTLEIGKAGLKQTESAKQKKAAINKCYCKLATNLKLENV